MVTSTASSFSEPSPSRPFPTPAATSALRPPSAARRAAASGSSDLGLTHCDLLGQGSRYPGLERISSDGGCPPVRWVLLLPLKQRFRAMARGGLGPEGLL